MERYKCGICGYIYDPEQGESAREIEPGTPFSELPADYHCPICGSSKEEFYLYE